MAVGHSLAVMNNRYTVKQLTQKRKSLTASATVVQTISNKFTAVVSNVVKWLYESHPMEHYGRHLEFHSFLVCGEAAHTKREKLGSFSMARYKGQKSEQLARALTRAFARANAPQRRK